MKSDRPINGAGEDRLHRVVFASQIAAGLLSEKTIEPIVVAIFGPRGGGKSSVLRLVRDRVAARGDSACIVDFKPWLYSGDLELAAHLLSEIGEGVHAALKDRDANLASKLVSTFSGAVRVARAGSRMAARAVAQYARAPQDLISVALPENEVTARDVHAQLVEQLADLPFNVFVFIDEVDWLPADEIRELVRVLRAVADLPRTKYVLAFDRARMEKVLGSGDPGRGRGLLEKIVDESYEVPPAADADLRKMLVADAEGELLGAGIAPRRARSREVRTVLEATVLPFAGSPRDVGRYVRSLPAAVRLYGSDLGLAGLLGLAAVRVFTPDAFSLWLSSPETRDALTKPPPAPDDAEAYRARIRGFWEAGQSHAEQLRGLTRTVFPSAWKLMSEETAG